MRRFGRIPTSLFASDPSVDTFKREQEMLGYQFEKQPLRRRDIPAERPLRPCRRHPLYAVWSSVMLNGDPTGDSLARGNSSPDGIANQGNLDNQLEYRFNTGILRTRRCSVSTSNTITIDDCQGSSPLAACPAQSVQSGLYPRPRVSTVRAISGLRRSRRSSGRLSAGPDQTRSLHPGAQRPQRLGSDHQRSTTSAPVRAAKTASSADVPA